MYYYNTVMKSYNPVYWDYKHVCTNVYCNCKHACTSIIQYNEKCGLCTLAQSCKQDLGTCMH